MNNKQYAILGLLAPILFWLTYFVMAAQRPEYDFLTKAISELGSVEAANKWTWNIFGYIITGICISIFSIGLYKKLKTDNSGNVPFIAIFLSGLFMAVSGVFPGDFENKNSVTMLLHTVGSFGSYIFFLIGAFTYPKQMKKSAYWASAITPTLVFTWFTILFGSWAFFFPDIPAVGQRLVFMFYFLWIIFTAFKLYFAPGQKY